MKKFQLLSVFFALPLFANGPSNEDLQREIDQLKFSVENLTQGSGMPVSTTVEGSSSYGFSLSADVLFWQTQSDLVNYAYQSSQTFANALPESNYFREVEIDWAWGFRVGAGYQFEYDNWRLQAEYTYLRPNGSSTLNIANDTAGRSSLSNAATSIQNLGYTAAKIAKSTYNLDYDYVTLELAKNFCISRHVDLATHWGLAAGWMSEKQTTSDTGGTESGFLNTNTLTYRDDGNFWGIGPKAGLGAFWHMGLGFSIFGDMSGEILVGKMRNSHVEQLNDSDTNYYKVVFDGYRYRPQLFMQLGLAYDAYFNDASQHFGLRAGWENQVWFNQSVKLAEALVVRYGDIQFSGLTIKAMFEF